MYFPASKVIIKHPEDKNKILLIKRKIKDEILYEPAGGRIEINFEKKLAESFEECAVREIHEELGLFVKLERYIGSYYFFWSIDPNKCSCCALFVADIIGKDESFITNKDTIESHLEPIWVSKNDIINKKIDLSAQHVGLENLIKTYFYQI